MVHGVCDFSYSFSACPDMKNRRLRVGVEVPTGKAVDRRGEINLCLAWQLERGIRGLFVRMEPTIPKWKHLCFFLLQSWQKVFLVVGVLLWALLAA